MVKKTEPLKLGTKSREISIPKDKTKSYPKGATTAMLKSQKAVESMADVLVGLGFPRHEAYRSLALQLHGSLVALTQYHNLVQSNAKAARRSRLTKGGK